MFFIKKKPSSWIGMRLLRILLESNDKNSDSYEVMVNENMAFLDVS
jgi:hypothetical protein